MFRHQQRANRALCSIKHSFIELQASHRLQRLSQQSWSYFILTFTTQQQPNKYGIRPIPSHGVLGVGQGRVNDGRLAQREVHSAGHQPLRRVAPLRSKQLSDVNSKQQTHPVLNWHNNSIITHQPQEDPHKLAVHEDVALHRARAAATTQWSTPNRTETDKYTQPNLQMAEKPVRLSSCCRSTALRPNWRSYSWLT